MGRGGGSAETRRSHRGKKRAVSGELDDVDQRESISRRLPEEERGQKRSSDGDGDFADQRENTSRRLPDDGGQRVPTGTPQPLSPGTAGAVVRSKKKVRWDSDATESASRAAWGGTQRDIDDDSDGVEHLGRDDGAAHR